MIAPNIYSKINSVNTSLQRKYLYLEVKPCNEGDKQAVPESTAKILLDQKLKPDGKNGLEGLQDFLAERNIRREPRPAADAPDRQAIYLSENDLRNLCLALAPRCRDYGPD
jgi:hypothetical protein